jgi:hypothetical protein
VPSDGGEIEILNALAIDVNFEIRGKLGNPFDDASLSAMGFVEERRDNCERGPMFHSDSQRQGLGPGPHPDFESINVANHPFNNLTRVLTVNLH